MPFNRPTNHGWEEERGQAASHLDLAHPRQGCSPPGCVLHLLKYQLSKQVHEGEIEMHTSLQVHMCKVATQEQ